MATVLLFQKNLSDLIKGIRTNKKGEADFIQQCIDEIRQELKNKEILVKVTAISKMTYLYMLGYDMDFAAFNVIEVMSETSFAHKRIGYLAATLAFHDRLEVLPLVTNLVKKDLLSSNQFEVGMALTCLANICTPELAHDIVSDVVTLLNSQRNYVRKKAVLCLYKVIQQYPGALRPTFPRLFEKLDESSDKCDPDPVVRCAVVSVLCELARKHPANYLGLAVSFFNLLCSQLNNWTMIKIVKLFAALTPHEPRLGKKIAEPMTTIINTTQAKSLSFEACLTVAIGLGKTSLPVTRLALEKLRSFIEDPDQNLKFLGLVGMTHFMASNPKMLVEFREVIVECLKDNDNNIRTRALDLTQGLVSKKSLHNIVAKMCDQLVRNPPDDEWTNLLIRRIVETCTQDDYSCITDFEWYLRVLMDLTQTQSTTFEHGDLIAGQFLEVTQRVTELRQFSVKCMVTVLSNPTILTTATNTERSTHWKILRVATHIAAEYVQLVPNVAQLFQSLVDSRLVSLPGEFQSVCVSSLQKIALYAVHTKALTLEEVVTSLCPEANPTATDSSGVGGMDMYYHSPDVETQERALLMKKFVLTACKDEGAEKLQSSMLETISIELMPVPPDAQKQVPLPADIDFDTPLVLTGVAGEEEEDSDEWSDNEKPKTKEIEVREEKSTKGSKKDKDEYNKHRKMHASLYLEDKDGGKGRMESANDDSLPPMVQLPADLHKEVDLGVKGLQSGKKKTSSTKKYVLASKFDAPEGYVANAPRSSLKQDTAQDDDDGLNIDVLKPIGKDEVLPTIKPYERPEAAKEEEEKAARRASRKSKQQAAEGPIGTRTRKDCTLLNVSREDVDVVIQEAAGEGGLQLSMLIKITNKLALSLYHVEISFDNFPAYLALDGPDGAKKRIAIDGKIGTKETKDIRALASVDDGCALFAALPLNLTATIHYKTKEVKHARVALSFAVPLWMFCKPNVEDPSTVFTSTIQAAQVSPPLRTTIAVPPAECLKLLACEFRWCIVEVLDDTASMCLITNGGAAAVLVRAISSKECEVVIRSENDSIARGALRAIGDQFGAETAVTETNES
jgi:AP-3 complex subunit delta-1